MFKYFVSTTVAPLVVSKDYHKVSLENEDSSESLMESIVLELCKIHNTQKSFVKIVEITEKQYLIGNPIQQRGTIHASWKPAPEDIERGYTPSSTSL